MTVNTANSEPLSVHTQYVLVPQLDDPICSFLGEKYQLPKLALLTVALTEIRYGKPYPIIRS